MSIIRRSQQWGSLSHIWHLYDAKWQDPFQSALMIKEHIMGLKKPLYHPLNQSGDHVVVMNSKFIAMRGNEWRKRVYYHHTGYAKGDTWTLAWELHGKDPTMIMKKAVYRSMKGTLQRRYIMEHLHVYPDENIPEDIVKNITRQIRQLRPVPIRLDHIPKEEVEQFPKIYSFPEDYLPREVH